jgi:hypothetical protein
MNIGKVYPKRVGPTLLTASAVSQFTADTRYGIERWSFTNYSATDPVDVTVYIVPSGGSVADGYKIIGELPVAATDLITVPFPITLDVGDQVYALASSTSSVNMTFLVNPVEIGIQ